MHRYSFKRRQLLSAGLALPALAILPATTALAVSKHVGPIAAYSSSGTSRRIRFFHTHTYETLDAVYREGTDYLPDGLEQINRFLRDFRTGEIHPIEPQLLDQLADLQSATGSRGEFQIISGYRSPQTNDLLRKSTSGVAKKSLHMRGLAIDVRLTDVRTKNLRAAAIEMQRGGVGYYPNSDFVHLDTGRVRTW